MTTVRNDDIAMAAELTKVSDAPDRETPPDGFLYLTFDGEQLTFGERRMMMKADFSGLSREQQGKFTAQVSVMASIAMMTKPKQMDRIAASSPSGVKELPISQTLAMFSRSAS